jgi:hypothetical protein
MEFDENFWRSALFQYDWYLQLADNFSAIDAIDDIEERKKYKIKVYNLVEEALRADTIPLASSGRNLDKERQVIDTIVLHHTNNQPGMSLDRLNAMQLLRIYGMHYAVPVAANEQYMRGSMVWSNHFYNGKQVFWAYHWLVRADGSYQRILDDKHIGWQAGNWDINKRSVAICFDDDLTDKAPSDLALLAAAKIIAENYPDIGQGNIIGHCDANSVTICPGNLFKSLWKNRLLEELKNNRDFS